MVVSMGRVQLRPPFLQKMSDDYGLDCHPIYVHNDMLDWVYLMLGDLASLMLLSSAILI